MFSELLPNGLGIQSVVFGQLEPLALQAALAFVRDEGFSFVEAQHFVMQHSAAEIATVFGDAGVECRSLHIRFREHLESASDFERTLEYANTLGVKNILCTGCKGTNEDQLAATCERLAEVVAECSLHGKQFLFHCMDWAFETDGGCHRPIDEVLRQIPKLRLAIDTFWAHAGGVPAPRAVNQFAGSCNYFHLKDARLTTVGVDYVPTGDGDAEVLQALATILRTHSNFEVVYEQDQAICNDPTSPAYFEAAMRDVKKSCNTIRLYLQDFLR